LILSQSSGHIRHYPHPVRNHNPHQNCLKLYFSTLKENWQMQNDTQTAKSRLISQNIFLNLFCQLSNAKTAKKITAAVASVDQNLPIEQTHFCQSAVGCEQRYLQQTLQREAF